MVEVLSLVAEVEMVVVVLNAIEAAATVATGENAKGCRFRPMGLMIGQWRAGVELAWGARCMALVMAPCIAVR